MQNKLFLQTLENWKNAHWDINLVSNQRIGPRQPPWDINDYDRISKYSTSTDYIEQILDGGVPRYYSVVHPFGLEPYGKYMFDNMPFEFDQGTTALYRPQGFVSWHNDADDSGWFFMLTYSPYGNGCFKYVDPESSRIIVCQDSVGWNTRTFYAGDTPDTYFWHCALAPSLRFTWLFKFYTEEKYKLAMDILAK